jgi:hypothetical protein
MIWGANGLIGAIGGPLGNYFLENILGMLSEKSSKNLLKSLSRKLYYFLKVYVTKFPKICHLKSFPRPFTNPFTT